MKGILSRFLKHPLVSSGAIVFVSSFLGNILNYLFNLLMGRFLSVSDYGVLVSLASFFSLFGIFPTTFTGIFAKFSALYHARGDTLAIKGVFSFGAKFVFVFSTLILLVLFVFQRAIMNFLNIQDSLIMLLIFGAIYFAIIASLPFGIFQGKMRFYLLSFLGNSTPLIKICFGLLSVFLGFKVAGAIFAIFLGSFLPTIISFILLLVWFIGVGSKNFSQKEFSKEFARYGFGFFIASLGMIILSNIDVILVRHFFDEIVSGQYAALSLMGKAIFFFTSPISFVFFPLIAYKKEKKERLFGTLMLASLLTLVFSVSLSIVYFVFPNLILKIFFPAEGFKSLVTYLGPFTLYVVPFSLVYLFNSFFLSIGRVGVCFAAASAAIAQIVLIYIFHQSLFQIILVLSSVSFLLLCYFLIYYAKYARD